MIADYRIFDGTRFVSDLTGISLFLTINNLFCITCYVKPSNHEARKHKKYRTDISRRENMFYDEEANTYTCANGKLLKETREKKTHSASGLEITTSIYECSECAGCPLKEKCIRVCGSK